MASRFMKLTPAVSLTFTGLEIAREFCRQGGHPDITTLVVTAQEEEEANRLCRESQTYRHILVQVVANLPRYWWLATNGEAVVVSDPW